MTANVQGLLAGLIFYNVQPGLKPNRITKIDVMNKKLNSDSSAGTEADSDMQPIVNSSASIAAIPVLNAVPFTLDDVEDVQVIIKAKGKHYGLVPKRDACTDDEAKEIRIGLLSLLTTFHYVVDKALEDLSA